MVVSTPNSFDITLLPPLTLALPLVVHTLSLDQLPLYTRDITLPLPPLLSIVEKAPQGVQPRVLLKPDWYYNITEQGINIVMPIPNSDSTTTIALFVYVSPNEGSPQV